VIYLFREGHTNRIVQFLSPVKPTDHSGEVIGFDREVICLISHLLQEADVLIEELHL
jgi:hypothetical protein